MKRRAQRSWSRVANRSVCLSVITLGLAAGVTWATHEADHRFTVEGFVCELSGAPSKKTEVVVKDTRVNVGATIETDERGYYRTTLHLHNDNLGDPVLVAANREEQRIKVEFDPNDLESERKARVDFGTGCQQAAPDEVPGWVWYTLGALGVGTAALVAGRMIQNQRRAERAKGHRRQRR
ncbi:hypothetical protein YTPLAS18_08340 [Nitrospira sp.]|nr:hypothetical protein YTPLAS18_08340 [Nitrospira sp.]